MSAERSPSSNSARRLVSRASMGSVGDAYDNAMCESLFATAAPP